jgi:hypothetical protein
MSVGKWSLTLARKVRSDRRRFATFPLRRRHRPRHHQLRRRVRRLTVKRPAIKRFGRRLESRNVCDPAVGRLGPDRTAHHAAIVPLRIATPPNRRRSPPVCPGKLKRNSNRKPTNRPSVLRSACWHVTLGCVVRGGGSRRPKAGCRTTASTDRHRCCLGKAIRTSRGTAPSLFRLAICEHIRAAWDDAHPDHPLHQQDVVITLPASFDEVARELTVAAARAAGLSRVFLIEEPQAAFYAWINRHRDDWHKCVSPGQMVLVCDIGGGTSDFTLIRVRPAGQSGDQVQFHRVAVGKHLILGGDNLDLALARHRRIEAGRRRSVQSLVAARLGSADPVQPHRQRNDASATLAPTSMTVTLASDSARLIGGGQVNPRSTADEVDRVLVDGFLSRSSIATLARNRVKAAFASSVCRMPMTLRSRRHLSRISRHTRTVGLVRRRFDQRRAPRLDPVQRRSDVGVAVARSLGRLCRELVRWR